jgi:hypothetical protein
MTKPGTASISHCFTTLASIVDRFVHRVECAILVSPQILEDLIVFTLSPTQKGPAATKLLSAMAFGLASAAAAPVYAIPISPQSVTVMPKPVLNATIPTKTTTLSEQYTGTSAWSAFYAVQGIAPAASVSFSLQATGSAISGWYGNIYLADGGCDTPFTANATLNCTGPFTLFGAMTNTAGVSLTLPTPQPGFQAFTPSQYFIIETGGTGNNPIQEYTISVNTDVPAPAALGLLGIGLVGMGLTRRRNGVAHTAAV